MKISINVIAIILLFISIEVNAGYVDGMDVLRLRVHSSGEVYFRTSTQPAGTCSNWGEYFKFDHTTAAGKSLLSTLLAAKASGTRVAVWYIDSAAPGTDQTSGCSNESTATATGISM